MKIKAQLAMVLNLDKCIGCHTCSIPCKNVWTNRKGAEYMWFNNVETKPGIGYPKKWENQDIHKGGWVLKGSCPSEPGTRPAAWPASSTTQTCLRSTSTTNPGPTITESSSAGLGRNTSRLCGRAPS